MPPVRPTKSTGGEGSRRPQPAAATPVSYHLGIAVNSPARAPSAPEPAPTAHTPSAPATSRADLLASFGPLVIAVRWATVALGLAFAALNDEPRRQLVYGAPLVIYAAIRTVRPLRYLTNRIGSFVQVLFEVGLSLAVVVSTGFWGSPYVFCVATAILAAGFARGFAFALRTASAVIVAVALPYHLEETGARLVVTMQWGAELMLVGIIAGYARRLFGEVEEQDVLARQANELLAQLHEVAQTLPTSLDLEETVTQAVADLRTVADLDVIAVLLRDPSTSAWTVAIAEGVRLPGTLTDDDLPPAASAAAHDGRAVRASDERGSFFAEGARSGAYIPLLARSRLTGMLVMETFRADGLPPAVVASAEAIGHRAALALDNARWFTLLRRVGADEERTRIARDLHDRVGQSLAFVGFELDRIGRSAVGQPVEGDLARLRDEVRRVVSEVRDTLYDLRTDVSERQDLVTTLTTFLDRVRERTGIRIDVDHEQTKRMPLRQERELWRIAQEAVTNSCRHASPQAIWVRWYCDGNHALLEVRDDGRGMPSPSTMRADSYGVRGMRERAAAIGGRLAITAAEGGGTLVRCEVGR